MKPIRVLFALPGLHLVNRGAEAAFEQIACQLSRREFEVTLIGAGPPLPDRPYAYIQGRLRPRERFRGWPSLPVLRSEYRWEEASFAPSLWRQYRPKDYDLTVTCSYPFVNWILRAKRSGRTPRHIYITENGDWAVHTSTREYKWFGCEGLVCTNPEYFERNRKAWNSALIPNGVDVARFTPGLSGKEQWGIPREAGVVCMVSALIDSKYPREGIRAVAAHPSAHLLLAGDGPLHRECDALGEELLGSRYHRITVPMEKMPEVYRSGDVFMHLSRSEAFGNIYIEALACGIPVLAHDTETTAWILGEHGERLDTSDPTRLQDTLTRMLDIPSTEDAKSQRHTYAANRFSWDEVGRQYSDFFKGMMEDG